MKQYPDFTLVIDDLTLWYFTKPSHPAHPGVIERELIQVNDSSYVRENGWSFAPDGAQPAFKKWMAQIQELDRKYALTRAALALLTPRRVQQKIKISR